MGAVGLVPARQACGLPQADPKLWTVPKGGRYQAFQQVLGSWCCGHLS